METFTVTVDGSGWILLPAKIRKQLKVAKGSELLGTVRQRGVLLKTRPQALQEARQIPGLGVPVLIIR